MLKISQERLIRINQKLDYIPIVSTATGIINLITKIALHIFLHFKKSGTNVFLQQNKYLNYILEKGYLQTTLLLIPGLNIIVADAAMKDSRRCADQALIDRQKLTVFRSSAQAMQALCEHLSHKSFEQLTTNDLDDLYSKLKNIQPLAELCYSHEKALKPGCDLIAKFRVLCGTTNLRARIQVAKKMQARGRNSDGIKKKIFADIIIFAAQLKAIEAALQASL